MAHWHLLSNKGIQWQLPKLGWQEFMIDTVKCFTKIHRKYSDGFAVLLV